MNEEFNHKHYNYRWTRGFLLAIIFTLILLSGAVFAQNSPNTPSGYSIDGQTGNLIPNGALTSGTGWTSSSGSPGWVPNASPQGSFGADGYTFSYQMEELGKSGINLGGFNLGYTNTSAIFVTGFSYGLTYRFPCANSIGTNCDGTSQNAAPPNPTQDNLRVEIGYYPASGAPTFYTHQLGLKNINDGNPAYNPNWQTLAETITFAGAKPLAQAGSVNMGIVGQDAGFWACLGQECYGPQVKNAYVKANYSVDPCILNPAFNPNCPGFQNILQGNKSPTFYYSYNIAQSLPHIGGGVVLHGYDYGFNWYNYGACYNTFMFWCTDWRTDGGGNINFRISDKNNTTMLQNQWYVSGNNSGGSYSNRYLFNESRNSLDMGSVQWWASDVWNHFGWVGWTRPIWTPDPCYTNGLYSPNCSNFRDAVDKVLADIKTQQEKISALNTSSSTPTPFGTITTTLNDVTSTNPSVTVLQTSTLSSVSSTAAPLQQQTTSTALALDIINRNRQQQQTLDTQASRNAMNSAQSLASASVREAEALALESAERSLSSTTTTTSNTNIGMFSPPGITPGVLRNQPTVNAITVPSPVTITSSNLQVISPESNNIVENNIPAPSTVTLATTPSIENNNQSIPIPTFTSYTPILPENVNEVPLIISLPTLTPPVVKAVEEPSIVTPPTPTVVAVPVVEAGVESPIVAPPAITVVTVPVVEVDIKDDNKPIVQELEVPKIIAIEVPSLEPPTIPKITETNILSSVVVATEIKEEPVITSTSPTPINPSPMVVQETIRPEILTPPVAPIFATTDTPIVNETPIVTASIAPTIPIMTPNVETTPIAITTDIPLPRQESFINSIPVTTVEPTTVTANFTTDKTNPINDIIDNKPNTDTDRKDPSPTSTVNRNAQNNEVAGGVDIKNLAVVPAGFNQYAALMLRDAAFYAPKEIYRNQRTVDNARALRNLASDRLHQEMVNQQYLPR